MLFERTVIKPVTGRIIEYAPRLTAFEFGDLYSDKVLIFVGGLGDGYLTVPYETLLATELAKIGWSLIQVQISSSLLGWGTGSLSRDSLEISELVRFLRTETKENGGGRTNVGLMGHSTGTQNIIHYLTKFEKKWEEQTIDFGILQASVSDRDAMSTLMEPEFLKESIDYARSLIDEGKSKEVMPLKYGEKLLGAPINAYRWNSLASARGDDDFFSADLTADDHKQTFGKVQKPLLVLYSGSDEFVPKTVDKQKVFDGFKAATDPKYWSSLSEVVKGGTHNLGGGSTDNAKERAVSIAVEFVKGI